LSSIQKFSKNSLKKSVTTDKSQPVTGSKEQDFSQSNGGLGGGIQSSLFNAISSRRIAIKPTNESDSEDSIENDFD
jgi:hypothetical protein